MKVFGKLVAASLIFGVQCVFADCEQDYLNCVRNCTSGDITCSENCTNPDCARNCNDYDVTCALACTPCAASNQPLSSVNYNGTTTVTSSLRENATTVGIQSGFLTAEANEARSFEKEGILAQAKDSDLPMGSPLFWTKAKDHNAIWGRGLWQTAKQSNTRLNSYAGFAGYDYLYSNGMVGGSLGYLQSIVKPTVRGGGHVDFFSAALHGLAKLPSSFFCEYGFLGSLNFNHAYRNTSLGVARTTYHSYTIDPHIDFGYDWNPNRWFVLEPFVSSDFVFNFQNSHEETGVALLNLHYQSLNSGLLRIEPGLNLYERWEGDGAVIVFRQKFSYVRKQVLFGSSSQVFLTSNPGAGSITVDSGLLSENLGAVTAQIFGRLKRGGFGSITYRGEWGSNVQLNELRARIGLFF